LITLESITIAVIETGFNAELQLQGDFAQIDW
jgi:hypothetical protein